jgi:hypothetical protein
MDTDATAGSGTLRTLVMPEYRTVILHDADADGWLPGPAAAQGVTGDGYRIVLVTWQELAPVAVDVTVLAGEPEPQPAASGDWVGECAMTLHCATGVLVLQGGVRPGLPDSINLPRAGTFHVRARWRGGAQARHRTQETLHLATEQDWDLDRMHEAFQELAGIERYRFDLWPATTHGVPR